MPELPEVENTRLGLLSLINKTVQHVHVQQPRLRWPVPDDLDRLKGQRLIALERRAKYILAHFEGPNTSLLLHLGMSGRLNLHSRQHAHLKHDHVWLDFNAEPLQLRYHDPRRFGSIQWLNKPKSQQLLASLGVEPLTDAFNAPEFLEKIARKQVAIKIALMDQRIVVGVGNIYAAEALFLSGIHPARPAHHITLPEAEKLVMEVKRLLCRSIELGGSTLRDYSHGQGQSGQFQQTFAVYGRAGKPCVQCKTLLENLVIGQRASVFCPTCQPD